MFLSRFSSKLIKNSVKITKQIKCVNCQVSKQCSSSATSTENLISLYNLRKTIKAAGCESEEGTTCIQTVCPVCCFDSQKPSEKIYINKITGMALLGCYTTCEIYQNPLVFFRKFRMSSMPTQRGLEFARKILQPTKKVAEQHQRIEKIPRTLPRN
jgi:hypothetical protein